MEVREWVVIAVIAALIIWGAADLWWLRRRINRYYAGEDETPNRTKE